MPLSRKKTFDLAYENLSIHNLRQNIKQRKSFQPYVLLSTGSYDLKSFLRTRQEPENFQHELREVVKHLLKHGVQHLYLLLPFPNPRITFNDLTAWGFYDKMLKAYTSIGDSYQNVTVLNYNSLISKKTDWHQALLSGEMGTRSPTSICSRIVLR